MSPSKIANTHICRILAFVFVFVPLHSCRKKQTVQPTTISTDTTTSAPLILPTKDLEDEYVWHRSDTPSGSVYSDGIIVINDTTIELTSDARYYKAWGGMGKYYRYSSKNDTEVIFGTAPYTITYKFKRGLVVKASSTTEYTAVIGASARWKATQDERIGALRNWHRTTHYFVYNNTLKDTTITLPDTLASAFGLVGYPYHGYDDLQFCGADSVYAFYNKYTFGAGPYKLTTTISLDYYAIGDSVHLFITDPGAFPTSWRYSSF